MKFTKTIGSTIVKAYSVLTNKCVLRTYSQICSTNVLFLYNNKIQTSTLTINKRFSHIDDNVEDDNEITNGIDDVYSELYQQPQSVKHILYSQSKDALIKRLNESASLQDILTFIKNHGNELATTHVTQIVLVLWDLQKMFYHISLSNSTSHIDISEFGKLSENYIQTFKDDEIYTRLWTLLENKQDEFTVEQLSYILLYLYKMGIHPKESIMSILISQFHRKFTEDSSLSILARFMTAIYMKRDLSYYYNIQQFIPIIIASIDKCNTIEELSATTICLNNMSTIINNDILLRYKEKVTELLESNIIEPKEYKTIIRIMVLLNYPQWRERNAPLIISCMELLKTHLHLLNVNELLAVHEVFCRIQEPGDILNEIQRCSYRYLQQLEEEMSPQLDIRLRLFSCITYFAPPSQRPRFIKIIQKYIDYELDGTSLLELHKIILFTKISDINICAKFWRKISAYLDNRHFLELNLLKICQNYISFNENIPGRRCTEFENKMIEILQYEMKYKLGLIPFYFPTIASFLLIFEKDPVTLRAVISKIQEYAECFNSIDCLNLSHGLRNALIENPRLTKTDVASVRNSLDRCTYKNLLGECDLTNTNLLLKSYICRSSKDEKLFHRLLNCYKITTSVYSSLLNNGMTSLFMTNTLLPDVINMAVEYTIRDTTDILGFNAERIIYLCYYLGYLPDKHEEFSQSIIDTIIRDQERMSGLSYLQTCLSLCFFHKLPQFFVKQIFNVEFLEKLDIELANCYFKDVYPSRVRYNMMQLNRAVCLDYPESNVPWFHEKYVQEEHKKVNKPSDKDYILFKSIKECLVKLAKHENYVRENEISSYGYHIDFTMDLEANDELTDINKPTQRIAILIMRPSFYTRVHKRLKGFYQLKIRHLEILGYKVGLVNSTVWKQMVSIEEKMNYLINIVKTDEIYSNLLKTLQKAEK